MFGSYLERVRAVRPLIHNITNYVTVNDVANMLLAAGASPIMADEPQEAAQITALCSGLNINLGTLNARTIEGMLAAGVRSKELAHVTLLDPVGAGASDLRTQTAINLMDAIGFDIIRGNISEINTLAKGSGTTRGVDADPGDVITEDNLPEMIHFAGDFAKQRGCISVITGAIDLVSDGERCYVIRNGHPRMSRITGSGCMLSGLMTAFAAANPAHLLEACAAAVCTMGLAGEIGHKRLLAGEGNATYRSRLIDAVDQMTGEDLEQGANYELR